MTLSRSLASKTLRSSKSLCTHNHKSCSHTLLAQNNQYVASVAMTSGSGQLSMKTLVKQSSVRQYGTNEAAFKGKQSVSSNNAVEQNEKDPQYSGNYAATHKEEFSQEKKQNPPIPPVQSYTQPEHGRPQLDFAQGLTDTTYEGVQTVYDSTPPQDYTMRNTDDPRHPTGLPDVIKQINQSEIINSPLYRKIYENVPKSLDDTYAPKKLPSGFKDEESGQVYYDPKDKFLNTIPMKGLEGKFIDPDDFNPVEVTSNVARCDGTNRVTDDLKVLRESELDYRLGHPKVFIKLDRLYEKKRCPYCGVQYKRVPVKRLKAEPFDVESMPEEAENNEWFNMLEHKKHAKPRGHGH